MRKFAHCRWIPLRGGYDRLIQVVVLVTMFLSLESSAMDSTGPQFHFERYPSLDAMRAYAIKQLAVGTPRVNLHRTFVEQGRATLIRYPSRARVEKYIYDINLCNQYIWRWNISADFDTDDRLSQAYINGEPLTADPRAAQRADLLARSGKASIFKKTRPRPEASEGETQLAYLLLDGDSDLSTTDDQVLTGAGPSRADPHDLGPVHHYVNIEPWRSIFDSDRVEHIVPYDGSCADARAPMTPHKGQ